MTGEASEVRDATTAGIAYGRVAGVHVTRGAGCRYLRRGAHRQRASPACRQRGHAVAAVGCDASRTIRMNHRAAPPASAPHRARSEGRMKERHAVGGGWRSVTPLRHSVVNEAAGNLELPVVAFTTDSNQA